MDPRLKLQYYRDNKWKESFIQEAKKQVVELWKSTYKVNSANDEESHDDDDEILTYEVKYPNLSKMARDYLSIPDLVNRVENITTNIDIQQMEKTLTIELNGDNLGSWINCWIEQDTLRQEFTNIRYRLRSLKNIEYYTDRSLANQIIDTNNQSNNMADNTIVNLRAAFYTNNKEGEYSIYLSNDIADKLAKKGQCGNNLFKNNVDFIDNILSYFPVFIDNPIEVNIRRFILKILPTHKVTE
ncbi:hypothetical protein C1646_764533 [Rhizophagus diaphanus]|nr:hypothetical protein C1646_764533 [Rhizophagus diaphanus] [Rhizophagus sp. MUCL 43196]